MVVAANARFATTVRNVTILLMTVGISLLFLTVIRDFLLALLLATILSAMAQPLYRSIRRMVGGRNTLASGFTILFLTVLVVFPLVTLLVIVAGEAIHVTERVIPWFEEQLRDPSQRELKLPDWVPFASQVDLSSPALAEKLGDVASKAGGFLLQSLSNVTQGTASFALSLFVMIYAMFFFLKDGAKIREAVLHLLPVPQETKDRLFEKGISVTRATVKGTIVIGMIQGTLAGISYVIAGVPGAFLWGTLTAVASVVPAIGTTLVWGPVVIYLAVTGHWAAAAGVGLWCALVVGTIDNLLRPRLVGNDTQMPELLILLSTLGGLSLFGAVGLLIGPIIAALCVTMWDVCGVTFRDVLQENAATAAESATATNEAANGAESTESR